jgi:hypothetical protein
MNAQVTSETVTETQANSAFRPTVNILSTGNYYKVAQGKSTDFTYGSQVDIKGMGLTDITLGSRTTYNGSSNYIWNTGKRFEFTFSEEYKYGKKSSHTVNEQSTVQNNQFVLMTAGVTVPRAAKHKIQLTLLEFFPKYFSYFKYLLKLNSLNQSFFGTLGTKIPFTNTSIIGNNAAKSYGNAIQNYIIGPTQSYFKKIVSFLKLMQSSYVFSLKYEDIFHDPNTPNSVLQLSKDKGVFIAGGDFYNINGIEMRDSIHLSSYKQSRSKLFGWRVKEIYEERDADKSVDEEGFSNTYKRLNRKLVGGTKNKLGEFNGLKKKFKEKSFVNISDEMVQTKSDTCIAIANKNFSNSKNHSIMVSDLYTVKAWKDIGGPKTKFVMSPNHCRIKSDRSNLIMKPSSISMHNSKGKSAFVITDSAASVLKGDKSKFSVTDKAIKITSNGGEITISNNSVSIGSDLKVMGIRAASKFNDLGKLDQQVKQLKKKFDDDTEKMKKDFENTLKKMDDNFEAAVEKKFRERLFAIDDF